VNDFDQAARYAAKLDPPGFFRWLFDGPLVFRDWLDTRTIPFPGEPDRTCDTVAGFENPKDIDQPFAVVVEFQSQPASDAVERLLEYVVRLRRELRHGSQRKNKYLVAGALLNLTGPAQKPLLEMLLSTVPEIGLRFNVLVRTLREEEAASMLAAIESGETARCIPPWIPLMHGGKEAGIIAIVKAMTDLEELARWFDVALTAATLYDFRAAVQEASTTQP